MPSRPDDAITFLGRALEFFEKSPGLVQAELVVIAESLYDDPSVDGESKLMVPIAYEVAATEYSRAYVGKQYWLHYSYQDGRDGRRLWIIDCGVLSN